MNLVESEQKMPDAFGIDTKVALRGNAFAWPISARES